MKRSVCLVLALGSLLAGQASAADLYTAQVAVTGTGAPARSAAVDRALDEVLGRLLPRGQDAARARAALAAQADTLLAGSRYTQDGRRFEARFDAPALHEQLRRAGLEPWGEPRPRVLLWLAFDGGAGAELVGADSPLAAEVTRAGRRYGLPVELPLLDPEERAEVTVGTVVRLDWESLAAGSVRYGPDAFAGLLVTGDATRQRGRVNLSRPDGETSSAMLQADTLDELLGAALHHVAAELAGFYLAQGSGADPPPAPVPEVAREASVAPFERPRGPSGVAGTAPQGLAPAQPAPQQAFVPLSPEPGSTPEPIPAPAPGPTPRRNPQPAPEAAGSVAERPPAVDRLGTGGPAPADPASSARQAGRGMPGPVVMAPAGIAAPPVRALAPPVAGAPDGVAVDVHGVGNAMAYQQTQAQLRALPGVRTVHVIAATADVLTVEVRYPAGAAALGEALRADAVFEVIETAGDRVALRYRGG